MASVLLIDDEKILLNMFSRVLERIGCTVHIAENGRDGIRLFENEAPDLVITDQEMPGMDGSEVAQYIRSSKKGRVPVVGMSGTPWRVIPKDYDDILLKPFMIEELVDTVHRLVPGAAKRSLDA